MSEWDITDEDWPTAPRPDPSDQSVLIVDDDPSIRSMLGFIFEDEGFEVREAADGADAIDALTADAPDAMVLDLMMPRRRRSRRARAPVRSAPSRPTPGS